MQRAAVTRKGFRATGELPKTAGIPGSAGGRRLYYTPEYYSAGVLWSFSRLRKNTGTDESVPNRKRGISRMRIRTVDRSVCPRVLPQPVSVDPPPHVWLAFRAVYQLARGRTDFGVGILDISVGREQLDGLLG